MHIEHVKDTLKTFDDFKNKQKSVWGFAFWHVKLCIFWTCIRYTMHWYKTQMLKTISFGQNNKMAILIWAEAQGRLSKTVCGIFHFRFRFVFIKVFIFHFLTKCMDSSEAATRGEVVLRNFPKFTGKHLS